MELEKIVSLLGKSERDEQVKAMLSALGVKQPLHRPERGDEDSYVENLPKSEHCRMEFVFSTADSIESYTQEHLDGELIFHTAFLYPSEKAIADNVSFPLGVSVQANRAEQFKRLGKPEFADSDLRKYIWGIGGLDVHIEYHEDDKTIYAITYALPYEE